MDDATFLAQAIDLSAAALEDDVGGPFGALVVRDGRVVGRGRNRVLADHDPTAHAEMLALRDAGRWLGTHVLTGCVVYSSCEPCPMCLSAIYWSRADRLVFAATRSDAAHVGFDDARLYEELQHPVSARELETTHLLREEAHRVLTRWGERPDRVLY